MSDAAATKKRFEAYLDASSAGSTSNGAPTGSSSDGGNNGDESVDRLTAVETGHRYLRNGVYIAGTAIILGIGMILYSISNGYMSINTAIDNKFNNLDSKITQFNNQRIESDNKTRDAINGIAVQIAELNGAKNNKK